VIKGVSKHEEPIHRTRIVCLERFVRRGSLILIDASNEWELDQDTVLHDWCYGKEEDGSGSSTYSPKSKSGCPGLSEPGKESGRSGL